MGTRSNQQQHAIDNATACLAKRLSYTLAACLHDAQHVGMNSTLRYSKTAVLEHPKHANARQGDP